MKQILNRKSQRTTGTFIIKTWQCWQRMNNNTKKCTKAFLNTRSRRWSALKEKNHIANNKRFLHKGDRNRGVGFWVKPCFESMMNFSNALETQMQCWFCITTDLHNHWCGVGVLPCSQPLWQKREILTSPNLYSRFSPRIMWSAVNSHVCFRIWLMSGFIFINPLKVDHLVLKVVLFHILHIMWSVRQKTSVLIFQVFDLNVYSVYEAF